MTLQGGAEEDDKKTMTKQYGDVLFERYMRFLCKVRCVALQSIACVLECSAASWLADLFTDRHSATRQQHTHGNCLTVTVIALDTIDLIYIIMITFFWQDSSAFLDFMPCYSCSCRPDVSTNGATEADEDQNQDLDFSCRPRPKANSKAAKKKKAETDPKNMKHCLTPVGC